MRIALVVTGGVDVSGRERVIPALLALVERLAARHAVAVYALRHRDMPCSYTLAGATVHDLGRPAGSIAQYLRLYAALERDGPFDVVHGYWALPAGLAAAAAARRLGVPSVVTLDSGELVALEEIGYGLQRTLRHRLAVAAAVRLATRVTVCSGYMLGLAAARGIRAEQLPLGADARRFRPAEAPAGPPWRLIHVASMNAVKDQRTLIEAVSLAAQRVPLHLDLVGEDTLGGAVQRYAARLGVAEHLSFHGFQPSDVVARLLARAHLHVVSSRHEAAGVAVLEAALTGVPTVGTACGYVADWTPDRAVAVPPREPDDLAGAIVALLNDPERRARLGAAARAWALAHDADWTAARFDRLYREIARC